ncbi:hypothetical protein L1887_28926 [Cichorium endivia]|nr:hypothetical protein L1887_28926 [Cichorium endivia]
MRTFPHQKLYASRFLSFTKMSNFKKVSSCIWLSIHLEYQSGSTGGLPVDSVNCSMSSQVKSRTVMKFLLLCF